MNVNAQTGAQATYAFLKLPVSARTAAMGGSSIAVKDFDINQFYQSPSLLNPEHHNLFSAAYTDHFAGINLGHIAYGRSYAKYGTFAAGLQYINYGTFDMTDVTGEVIGQFKAAEYAMNLAYAKSIDSLWTYGFNLKTIYSSLESYTSIGNALDAGITYFNPSRNFTFTAVAKNVGRQWKAYASSNNENLPFDLQVGISKKPKHVPFRFSVTAHHLHRWDLTYIDPLNPPITEDPLTGEPIPPKKGKEFADKLARHLTFGGEFLITKHFNLRLGYDYLKSRELKVDTKRGMAGFAFGLGFKISKFQLSYGRSVYHLAGGTNNLTMAINLSEFGAAKR